MRARTAVVVTPMPEVLNLKQAQILMREILPFLKADRPRLIFDFTHVRQIDTAGLDMLLRCLKTVMKRDGDLKLASLSPQAEVVLELTRVDRLFETFPTTTDAVRSFGCSEPEYETTSGLAEGTLCGESMQAEKLPAENLVPQLRVS
ncbi:MAG TPA: STAS domain-containing protein [Terriglobales bacterium]|nr:STAS domain-containing protein [Terriglobales bacterium]